MALVPGSFQALVPAPEHVPKPTTGTLDAPTMLLSGHQGPVYAIQFSPDGSMLASGSFDQKISMFRS
jgi:Prp8 binding protein